MDRLLDHKAKGGTAHVMFFAVCLMLMASFILIPNNYANAAMSDWQKGASIYPKGSEEFASEPFRQSLRNLRNTHANYVTLIIPLYQSNGGSTDIQTGWNTPTDASLISAITYAHSLGMSVMLKPHLDMYAGGWRAGINPYDRTTWFNNYQNYMLHYAVLAEQHGVEDICIGTELIGMTTPSINWSNTQNWNNLISAMRVKYSGKLTYSANWGSSGNADEKNNVEFWNNLDYIGISAYFNLGYDGSVSSLKSQWENINNNDIRPLSQRFGNKPVVFTEVGYRSVAGSHHEPWNYERGGAADQYAQSNSYQALFEYWSDQNYMKGVQLWEWIGDPNAGGEGNTDYTPQNKIAEGTMRTWFNTGVTPPPPPPNGSGYISSSSISPNPSTVEQSTSIVSNITNNGAYASNIIVDVEVYNSSSQKVFQKFYEGQNFSQGQTQTFTTGWTPGVSGNYTVRIGVFNNNWSQNYLWVNNAASITVNNVTITPPPPVAGGIDIWWPTQDSNIGGKNVPFKAILRNSDVNAYNMYWQVDGGALVTMPTNNTDYPHKQFDVDLTNWTWRGSGPYKINFVAKDNNGNILGERAVDVTIWH